MRAECVDTQSKAMKKLSLDQLCMVLNFAVTRMKHVGVSVRALSVVQCIS